MSRFLGTHIGPNVSANPGAPVAGQLYYNTTSNKLFVYNGTSWLDLTAASSGSLSSSVAGTAAAPAFTFTGDPNTGIYNSAADTLDFATNGTNRLSINSAGVLTVTNKISGVVDPTAAQDAATKNYVDTAQNTETWKQAVKAAAGTNVTLTAPGAAIDGVTLANGDRVLLTAQTTATENGIYIFNGSASTMTRAADAATATQLAVGTKVIAAYTGGTWGGTTFQYVSGAFTAQVWTTDNPLGRGNTIYTPGTGGNASGMVIGTSSGKAFQFQYNSVTTHNLTALGLRIGDGTNPAAAIDLLSSTSTFGGISFGNNESYLYRAGTNQLNIQGASLTVNDVSRGITVGSTWTPTNNNDVATKSYVDSVAQGLDAKPSVRAASTANVNTASPGTTLDGVTLAANDRILLKDQTTASQNGIYVWTASASALTRATDMDAWTEVPGAYTWVEEGTVNSDTGWVSTANAGGTLGTTSITWAKFAAAVASSMQKYGTTVGDGVTTSFVVTHNLGTLNAVVQVQEVGAPANVVYPDIQMTSSNTITLLFAAAPAASAYAVTVIG